MPIYHLDINYEYDSQIHNWDVDDQKWSDPLEFPNSETLVYGNFFRKVDLLKIFAIDNYIIGSNLHREVVYKTGLYNSNEINDVNYWDFNDYIESLFDDGWSVQLPNAGFSAHKITPWVGSPITVGDNPKEFTPDIREQFAGSYDIERFIPVGATEFEFDFNDKKWSDYLIYDTNPITNELSRATNFIFDIPIDITLPTTEAKFKEWFALDPSDNVNDIQITIFANFEPGNENEDSISAQPETGGPSFGHLRAFGGGGTDSLTGGKGNDYLDGGEGDDTLLGGAGDDWLIPGAPGDTFGDNIDGGWEGAFAKVRDFNDFIPNIRSDPVTWYSDWNDDRLSPEEAIARYGGDTVDYSNSSQAQGEQGVKIWIGEHNPSDETTVNGIRIGHGYGGDAEGDIFNDVEHAFGTPEDDLLIGNEAINVLSGGRGDDILGGGRSPDFLFGGLGFDKAGYRNWDPNLNPEILDKTKGVTVNLADPLQNTFWALGDIFDSIEGILGSDFNDKLVGNLKDNELRGRKGDDILIGNAGDDILDGGEHNQGGDTVNYSNANLAVHVNISNTDKTINKGNTDNEFTLKAQQGKGIGSDQIIDNVGTDDLFNFENIVGGTHNDILLGNQKKNTLKGGEGHDTLNGYHGDDTIQGGPGNDTIYGIDPDSASISGNNTITGGGGEDTAIWSGKYGDYDKYVSDFAAFFTGASVQLIIKNKADASSDTLTDQIEHLKFEDGEIPFLKVQSDAGVQWSLESLSAFIEQAKNAIEGFPVPDQFEGAKEWAATILDIVQNGLDAASGPNPWRDVFVKSHELLVDAVQKHTDTLVPGSDKFTAPFYDALREEVGRRCRKKL